jgi:hypothetical protein
MEVTELGIVTLRKAQQPEKTFASMVVTALDIDKFSNFWHPLKAALPMEVTELGIVMSVKCEQPPNVPSPMLVTELGIVTAANPEQPLKT